LQINIEKRRVKRNGLAYSDMPKNKAIEDKKRKQRVIRGEKKYYD
jgi:hypothetical protein